MTEIILEGQWTKAELFRAIRLAQSWLPELFTAACVVILAILLRPHALWATAGSALVLAMASVSFWVIPSKIWNNSVGSQEPRRVTITDDGILVKTQSLEVFMGWERFKRSRETTEFYFLVARGSKIGTPFRKSLFQTRDHEERFRSLVISRTDANLKPRRFKPGAGNGFYRRHCPSWSRGLGDSKVWTVPSSERLSKRLRQHLQLRRQGSGCSFQ